MQLVSRRVFLLSNKIMASLDKGRKQVAFIHPDLGIGGAERLIVDAALALQDKGHNVFIFTTHHDPRHCFSETKEFLKVKTVGDWLPRSILGRCYALCAYFRMIYCAIYLTFFANFTPEVIFCDQISACIPFLRVFSKAKIIFYCHFPDQLLTKRESIMKRVYRAPIDWVEERTTGMADRIFVNSQFTAGVFHDTFKRLAVNPEVLYPALNTKNFRMIDEVDDRWVKHFTFLSINRFERKKNLALALKAMAKLKSILNLENDTLQLVMAGGFDPRVVENVEHFAELEMLAQELGLDDTDVVFMQSPSDSKKNQLLTTSNALLYTPSGEHFGIVPIEAMFCGLPVIAVNEGGPTETVVDGETGFLRDPDEDDFADAMKVIYEGGKSLKERMGQAGRDRVAEHFSFEAFSKQLDKTVRQL